MNLGSLIEEHFPKWVIELLQMIGHMAERHKWRAFIVGGFVRDLILGKRNFDIDVAIEGDGMVLARELSRVLGGRLTIHERFLTATIRTPDGRRIDIATCRRERYTRPAVLPEVEPASAEEDMLRRDFSINAIAVHITPKQFGDVLDVCGGMADLRGGLIRILHERSFIDDPTRAFRAVRFEQRFSFTIEPQTECLMRDAIDAGMISLLTPDRIKHEWMRVCEERNPVPCILRMAEFDMLRWVHNALSLDAETKRAALEALPIAEESAKAADVTYERWLLYLMPLIEGANADSVTSLCRRYSLSAKHSHALLGSLSVDEALQTANTLTRPSAIKALWDALPTEVVVYALSKALAMGFEHASKSLIAYITNYMNAQPDVTGSELISAGIPAGPWIRAALLEALRVKLDKGCDREGQLKVALKVATSMAAVMPHGVEGRKEGSNTCGGERDKASPHNRKHTEGTD